MRETAGIWVAASLLALTATGLALPTHAQNVSDLAGYSTLSVSPQFEKFLTENPNIKRRLQENNDLSQALLSDKSLQAQLLAGKATLFEIQRELMRETAANADSTKQAPEDDIQLNARGSARAQQNLNQAMAVLSGQRETTATQEAAEVAEARQKALEKLLEKLEEQNTEALALFLADAELQQQIIDGAASIQDAMAELDVMVSEAEENALAETTESVLEDETSTAPESELATNEPTPIDINRIPTEAEAELDANGWPKYLNVPSTCAGPRENTEYVFQMRRGPGGEHTPARNDWGKSQKMGLISAYTEPGKWFYIILEDEGADKQESAPFMTEEVAAPFFTPNVDAGGRFYTVGGNYNNDKMLAKISECPGDFSNLQKCSNMTKLGSSEAAVMFYYRVDTGADPHAPDNVCMLEPGKRYFFNVQPMSKYRRLKEGTEAFRERIKTAPNVLAGTNRNGLISISSEFRDKLPPYAGPCLLSGGPYPPNYSGPINDHYPYFGPFSEYTCGDRVESANAGSCKLGEGKYTIDLTGSRTTTIKCYDPEDKLPPQTFSYEVSCKNGVNTKTWLEGYGEPAYSSYVCGDNVCAAHRDGDTRKITYEFQGEPSPTVTEQCQFDEKRGRYDWVAIDHTKRYPKPKRRSKTTMMATPSYTPNCSLGGASYPIGTKLKVQCDATPNTTEPVNEILTCEQRAKKPALPRFIARNPDGTKPGSRQGTPRMGHRLSQCDISVIE